MRLDSIIGRKTCAVASLGAGIGKSLFHFGLGLQFKQFIFGLLVFVFVHFQTQAQAQIQPLAQSQAQIQPQASGSKVVRSCQSALHLIPPRERLSILRQEILEAQARDLSSGRREAQISNFIEGRASDIDSQNVVGNHVVSLGSGPDIFLPLYLYPQAKYFHLVDLLTGWGQGPASVIEEIEHRLASLNGEGAVTRIDNQGDWRRQKSPFKKPLQWKVQWRSPRLGLQEKIFSLHQLDFRRRGDLIKLQTFYKAMAPSDSLGGVVITGISVPLKSRQIMLNQLSKEGSMFTEMMYTNDLGETSTPADQKTLQTLKKDFLVFDLGALEKKFMYTPRRFLIKAKPEDAPNPAVYELLVTDLLEQLESLDEENFDGIEQIFSRKLELEVAYGVAKTRLIFGEAHRRLKEKKERQK